MSVTLGISTAALPEVALVRRGSAAAEAVASGAGQALESLVGLLEQTMRELACRPEDITRVGVCTGPGSFTGLRIGVAFANAFAQARGLPAAGVSSYDVAEFGLAAFPRIAVATGKPDHYYARVRMDPGATAEYSQGDGGHIKRLIEAVTARSSHAPAVVGSGYDHIAAGVGARRVALLSMATETDGGHNFPSGWTGAIIDYGQRPNAVINLEKREAPG